MLAIWSIRGFRGPHQVEVFIIKKSLSFIEIYFIIEIICQEKVAIAK